MRTLYSSRLSALDETDTGVTHNFPDQPTTGRWVIKSVTLFAAPSSIRVRCGIQFAGAGTFFWIADYDFTGLAGFKTVVMPVFSVAMPGDVLVAAQSGGSGTHWQAKLDGYAFTS